MTPREYTSNGVVGNGQTRMEMRFVGTPQQFRDSQDPLVRAFYDRDAAASAARELTATTGAYR